MHPAKTRRERWADWVGCLAAIGFCVSVWLRASAMGILLAPTLVHNLVIAASFLIRPSARAKASSLAARFASYATTILVPAYVAVVPHCAPPLIKVNGPVALAAVGGVIWFAGCLFGVWGAWSLRYSFSIEPQARHLVTCGPYRFARHPIYAAYLLQYFGILLIGPSVGFALILTAWCFLAMVRIRFEEEVLIAVFPEYSRYRLRVGIFAPRLFSVAPEWRRRGSELQVEPGARSAVNQT